MPPATKQPISVFEEVKWERITDNRISTVMALLPASLQSRMGPFRSIRRSMSLYNIRTKGCSDRPSGSPPLSEANAIAFTGTGIVSEIVETDEGRQSDVKQLQLATPRDQETYSMPTGGDLPARTASGIHWRFARQGASLISIAFGGTRSTADEDDRVFERKVYIDGLAYLLNGLPQDLDEAEAEQIRSALPARVTARCQILAGQGGVNLSPSSEKQRSILHRAVQWAVVNAIFMFHMMVPYFVHFFKLSARMERKYKVSERLVGSGMDVAAKLGKRGATLTENICKMNDGMVGKALSDALAWTVDGVTRGISDGVGEGMVSVRVRGTA